MTEPKDNHPNPQIAGKALSEEEFAELAVIQDDAVEDSVNKAVPIIKSYLKAKPTIDGS